MNKAEKGTLLNLEEKVYDLNTLIEFNFQQAQTKKDSKLEQAIMQNNINKIRKDITKIFSDMKTMSREVEYF